MTYKAEEYRAKARECEERAERTGNYFIKEQLLEVAKKWRLIAKIRRKALAVGRLHELTARLRRSEQFSSSAVALCSRRRPELRGGARLPLKRAPMALNRTKCLSPTAVRQAIFLESPQRARPIRKVPLLGRGQ